MPVNIGVDAAVSSVTKRVASGFRERVEDVLTKFKSDSNEFDTGATATASQIVALSAGHVIEYIGSTVPQGWLECNGAEVPRSSYSDLYAVIGDTYGTAAAAANFKLPDLREASITGAGGTRTAGPETAVASTHDSDMATLTAANLPRHTHAVSVDSDAGGEHGHGWIKYPPFTFTAVEAGSNTQKDRRFGVPGVSYAEFDDDATTGLAGTHTHTASGTVAEAGSGEEFSVRQPSLAVMFLIKT